MLEEDVDQQSLSYQAFVASYRCYMYFVQKNKNKREKIEKNCVPFYSFYQWIDKIGSIFSDFRGYKLQIFWESMPRDPPTICSLASAKCQLEFRSKKCCAVPEQELQFQAALPLLISSQSTETILRLPQLKYNKHVTKKRLKLKWC